MTADLLTRAIAELDRRVEASTPGPWKWDAFEILGPPPADAPPWLTHSYVVAACSGCGIDEENAALMFMLRRTIPVQRAILAGALTEFKLSEKLSSHDEPGASATALHLARLILGEGA